MKADRIERSVELAAPPEFVWRTITEPEHINQWFGSEAEIDMREGGSLRFAWDDVETTGVVVKIDPPHEFAFRWVNNVNIPDLMGDQRPETLVTYQLEKIEGGTRLTVTETGFAAMRDDAYKVAFPQNTSGWRVEIDELKAYIEGLEVEQTL